MNRLNPVETSHTCVIHLTLMSQALNTSVIFEIDNAPTVCYQTLYVLPV